MRKIKAEGVVRGVVTEEGGGVDFGEETDLDKKEIEATGDKGEGGAGGGARSQEMDMFTVDPEKVGMKIDNRMINPCHQEDGMMEMIKMWINGMIAISPLHNSIMIIRDCHHLSSIINMIVVSHHPSNVVKMIANSCHPRNLIMMIAISHHPSNVIVMKTVMVRGVEEDYADISPPIRAVEKLKSLLLWRGGDTREGGVADSTKEVEISTSRRGRGPIMTDGRMSGKNLASNLLPSLHPRSTPLPPREGDPVMGRGRTTEPVLAVSRGVPPKMNQLKAPKEGRKHCL